MFVQVLVVTRRVRSFPILFRFCFTGQVKFIKVLIDYPHEIGYSTPRTHLIQEQSVECINIAGIEDLSVLGGEMFPLLWQTQGADQAQVERMTTREQCHEQYAQRPCIHTDRIVLLANEALRGHVILSVRAELASPEYHMPVGSISGEHRPCPADQFDVVLRVDEQVLHSNRPGCSGL